MKRPPIRNLIQNHGLTQPERFLEELDPHFAEIDDRSVNDLITLAWKLSDHLLFFEAAETGSGEELRSAGTWQQLLRHEQLFSLSLISVCSPVKYSRLFEEALGVLDPPHDSDEQWQSKVYPAFVIIITLCEEVDGWLAGLPVGAESHRELKIYIARLEKQVEQLLALYRQRMAGNRFWRYVSAHLQDWEIDRYGAPSESGALMSGLAVVSSLRQLFTEIQSVYSAIVNNAKKSIDLLLKQDTHQAHIGLFLAFLQLLEHNRHHLNQLTGRHLDFYLRDILRLKPKDRQPDSVHLTFELSKKNDSYRLPKATACKGGKNEDKIERLYDLRNELVLSKAKVAELKNLHVASRHFPAVRSIHQGIMANSVHGQGEALPEDNPKWPGFATPNYPLAELGFVVSSPLLRLSEGVRVVKLRFALDKSVAVSFGKKISLSDFFIAKVTTAKGWQACSVDVATNKKELILKFSFGMDVPAIVDYDPEKLGDSVALPVRYPLLHLTVDQKKEPHAYDILRQVKAKSLSMEIEVDNVRSLVLANDAANLKSDKPFLPFGSQPKIGSTFFVGHAESFAKPLSSITLSWNWVDAPQNLGSHYANYSDEDFQFAAAVDLRQNYNWDALTESKPLSILASPGTYSLISALSMAQLEQFEQKIARLDKQTMKSLRAGKTKFDFSGMNIPVDTQKALQDSFTTAKEKENIIVRASDSPFKDSFEFLGINYQASFDAEPFTQYSETLRQGGVRLRLNSPSFAFGHKQYPKLHSQAVTEALRPTNPDPAKLNSLELPYTPSFENLELSYTAKQSFNLQHADANLEILLLHPFGYAKPVKGELLAEYSAEGSLHIGLSNLEVPQNLTLLIQFAEGSGDPFKTAPKEIVWDYLAESGWQSFSQAEILRDGTLGFLQSGIIEFSLPKTISAANPEMPQDLHWLRVSVSDNTAALHDVLAITAQAGTAVYRDEGNKAKHLATALVAGSVSKLLVRNSAVKSVNQPFASHGGSEAESDTAFHSRCSERLRHKDRAVTLWDFEHLVLDRFPDIHKVKCLNHTCLKSEFSPGNVMLVLLPDLRNRNSRYPLRPAVTQSVLAEVEQYITERCSAHVDIHVVNPFYERIAIGGVAHFNQGYDHGMYQNKLWQDITTGLTPWQRGEKDIHFGGRIHSSVIVNLIEQLEYIDYLSDFSVIHYLGPDDLAGKRVDEVVATSNRSILVSNDTHTIQGVTPA